jgi:hypothetical protein
VDGVGATIVAERVEYLDEQGRLVTETLRDFTKNALKKRFASLDAFLKRWKSAERKQAIIDELENEGLSLDPLAEEVGKDLDPFDLICHVAFDQPPLTRRERADNVRKRDVFTKYGPQARAVLEALLQKYQDQGVIDLGDPRILQGQWILSTRTALKTGGAIDLRNGLPPSVTVVFAENQSQRNLEYQLSTQDRRQIDTFERAQTSLLILTPYNDTARCFRGFFNRRIALWEGHTRPGLERLLNALAAGQQDRSVIAAAVVAFMGEVGKGFQFAFPVTNGRNLANERE